MTDISQINTKLDAISTQLEALSTWKSEVTNIIDKLTTDSANSEHRTPPNLSADGGNSNQPRHQEVGDDTLPSGANGADGPLATNRFVEAPTRAQDSFQAIRRAYKSVRLHPDLVFLRVLNVEQLLEKTRAQRLSLGKPPITQRHYCRFLLIWM